MPPTSDLVGLAGVLDEFLRIHAKATKIVLIGMSMGGYFASRAFEGRIDGVVAYDEAFDVQESVGRVIAAAKKNPSS